MHWIDRLEEHRKLLITGIVAICLAIIFVAIRRFNVALDSYWHLKTGLVWLENGLSPWQDHFSFTFGGKTIHPPVIFDLLIAWLAHAFGTETGLEIFRFATFAAVFGLALLYLRRLRAPVFVYAIALPYLAAVLEFRAMVRPELLSYLFIVASMLLYHRARDDLKASTILPIIALIVLWVNYHSAIFAYIIFFGLFVDHGIRNLQDRAGVRTWGLWLAWGLAVLVAGALKPGFGHPVLGALNFAPEWKDLILEYAPSWVKFRHYWFPWAVFAGFFLTLGLCLWRRKWGLFVVTAVMTYYAISISRLVTPAGITIVCTLAWVLSEPATVERLKAAPAWLGRAAFAACMGLAGVYTYGAVEIARDAMTMNRTFTTGFPEDVVDYMKEQGMSGNLFNLYQDGGYLAYRLWPDVKIYIDGRTNILYPLEHSYRYRDALRYADVLNEEIDRYGINLALVQSRKHNFTEMKDSGRLQLDFVGFERSLFRRDNPNFPLTGTLLARPGCWEPGMLADLEAEQIRAHDILPANSFALGYLDTLLAYAQADDAAAYLGAVDTAANLDNHVRRFLGYRSLEQGLYEQTVQLVARLTDTEFADFLLVALAELQRSDPQASERVLDQLTKIPWVQVKPEELKILYRLLKEIRARAGLELFEEEYVDGLAEQFGGAGDEAEEPLSVAALCEAGKL